MKLAAGILLFASAMTLNAQTNTTLFGAYGGVNLNYHAPNFARQITGPSYSYTDNASNLGANFGIIGLFPINEDFRITGRAGYNGIGANFTSTPVTRSDTSFREGLKASLAYLELTPTLEYNNFFSIKNLYVFAGPEIGIALSNTTTATEDITTAAGTTQRLGTEQAIPSTNLRLAVAIGTGYTIPLGAKIFLAPEVSFRVPFTKVSSDGLFDSWTVSQLRAGVNFLFDFSSDRIADPEPSDLTVEMREVGYYTSAGTFSPVSTLRLEDVAYTELYPFLPYFFFEKNSAQPTRDYSFGKKERGEFSISGLKQDALEINKEALNIIGSRMSSQYQNSKLTITGTTDGKAETKAIAQQRADFAKNYLISNFAIAPDRITTESRLLPEKPSAQTVAEGDDENRRTELRSDTRELLDPLMIQSDNQRIAQPDMLEFRPVAISKDSITEWTLSLSQSGATLREFKGTGTPNPQRWLIRTNELTSGQLPVDYTFSAANSKGLSRQVNGSIPVEYISNLRKRSEQLPDRTIARYSLVLFDFDKSEMTTDNQRILESMVLPAVKFNSTVKVYGYTDRIGDEKHNRELSTKRAEAVRNVLKQHVPDAKYQVSGNGESLELFDNNSPIGRHLSRTVVIQIETPR